MGVGPGGGSKSTQRIEVFNYPWTLTNFSLLMSGKENRLYVASVRNRAAKQL